MILANIKDFEKYCALNSNFKAVFDFLKTLTPYSKTGIVGEDYRVNFSGQYCDVSDENADGTPKAFEAHKKYKFTRINGGMKNGKNQFAVLCS